MLAIIRVFIVVFLLILLCIASCIFCLLRPFHRNNVHHTAKILGKFSYLLGVEIEIRIPQQIQTLGPAVYIANHQSTYDLFTLSGAVQPNTVSVGKTSLKWIPFFGQMYWLTGNILIDRKDTGKALNTINQTAKKIKGKGLSILLFPEGTRSHGRGLLPFKTGAFRTAQQAQVPIVPVCVSNIQGGIQLNRWNNGKMVIEFLAPIELAGQGKESIRTMTNQTHELMQDKINQLSSEVNDAKLIKDLP